MTGEQLRASLRSGRRVYGTLIVSDSPFWPTVVAGIPGLDYVFIDTEHIAIDDGRLSWMCRTYDALGLVPVVRIPSPDPYRATKAIDLGARGIIAPYLESPEQVRALAGAVKHRPLKGERLTAVLAGNPDAVAKETTAYLAERNRGNLLIANIESVPAMDRLEDMLAIEEVDAVLIGPHDLSINLGIPEQYEDKRFVDAVSSIIGRARAAGKGAGIHYTYPDRGFDQEIRWARDGANLILHAADAISFRIALAADISRIRAELADDAEGSGTDTINI